MSGFAHDTFIILHSNSGGFNLHQNNLCCTLEVTLALYIYGIPWQLIHAAARKKYANTEVI